MSFTVDPTQLSPSLTHERTLLVIFFFILVQLRRKGAGQASEQPCQRRAQACAGRWGSRALPLWLLGLPCVSSPAARAGPASSHAWAGAGQGRWGSRASQPTPATGRPASSRVEAGARRAIGAPARARGEEEMEGISGLEPVSGRASRRGMGHHRAGHRGKATGPLSKPRPRGPLGWMRGRRTLGRKSSRLRQTKQRSGMFHS